MLCEMLYHVKDCVKHCDITALNLSLPQYSRDIETCQHIINFGKRFPDLCQQFSARNYSSLIELLLARPVIDCSANAADNPLPRVARKMQEQVSDAV